MEYKRSSHVEEEEDEGEEEEEEEDDEEEEEDEEAHHYTTAPAMGAPPQAQHLHAQVLASSPSSLADSAAFSRPLLSPNSSLVSTPLPPPGFLSPHHQPHALHRRRAERTAEAPGEAQRHLQRHQEPARNGVLAGAAMSPPASTLSLAAVAGAAVGTAAEALPWRYRECLRNHAARLGAHVLDGCGEFMPSPGEGAAALACAACGCHRSFHRREPVLASSPRRPAAAYVVSPSATPAGASSRLMPLLLAPPHMQKRPHVPASPLSAPAALAAELSSEELRAPPPPPPPHAQTALVSASAPPAPGKKRFRTKFTAEQKERMLEFAHRVGWRIHKPDAAAVDAFCAQVGIARRVLKVWMHNNKHLAKSQASPPQLPPLPHDPHHHHHHHNPPQHHQQQQHDA